MYPLIRFSKALFSGRSGPPLEITDESVSHHLCWPWDIDPWLELNNGRILTLYDLGRMAAGARIGLIEVLRRKGWGLAVAGCSVRYRKRITMFQRIEMRTRCVGWDDRFVYIVQAMWVGGTCCSQALLRKAVTSQRKAVPPAEVMAELGWTDPPPVMPEWVTAWIKAEGTRPWPPEAA